uniref:Uncharacterized protein n=1 Tax=Amphora coffeiformis TaxID=265554 RepID=A0A7S3L9E3_9STRA|mmetsp:Transcript_12898/g.24802  ORF Transcript_12898/g.24802 Transcript_12898/m.24802 type:complete len:215 (-) Transcript_12898:48-692(-)
MMFVLAIVASLLASSAHAFAPVSQTRTSSTIALQFSAKKDEDFRTTLSSVFAAAFLVANVATVAPAFAVDDFADFGSSQVVAARSGGRSGGRASSGGNSRSYRSSAPSTTYKSYSSTTYVAPRPSTVIVAPPSYSMGYSYNPLGGLGNVAAGYALGSALNGGNSYQDARQEQEIRQSQYELQQAKMKELELEARLRALEGQQRPAAPAAPVPAQ